MKNIYKFLGNSLLNIDDWFARRHIYFNKDKENHISFLCRWGFALIFGK